MSSNKKPMLLVILDGCGHREERQDDAILNASTPVIDCMMGRWATRRSATSTSVPGASFTAISLA